MNSLWRFDLHHRTVRRWEVRGGFLIDVGSWPFYHAGYQAIPESAGVRAENRSILACVITWADDGAVTIVRKYGMGTSLFGRRHFLCALAVFIPLATFVFPTSATASCGDYVIYRPQAEALAHASHGLPAASSERIFPGQAPCHGPLCSGRKPVDPMPTPPTPQQIDQRPLAILAAVAKADCPYLAGGGWPRLDESPLDGFQPSLLRPPCA